MGAQALALLARQNVASIFCFDMALVQGLRGAMRMQSMRRLANPSCVGSFRSFADVRFAKTHEWVKVESDGTATLGISHFAANALGEVVYADLPSEGATFSSKETVCTLESVKAVGEVYAPLDLEVLEVN